MIASITSKGQVTIPALVRKQIGLHQGSRVDFIVNEHNHLELIPVADSIKKLKGMVPKPTTPLSLDDMDKVMTGY